MKVKQTKTVLILLFNLIHHFGFSNAIDSIQVSGQFLILKSEFVSGNLYQFKSQKNIKSFKIVNGNFSFQLPSTIEPGVYRLYYEGEVNHSHTDIIIDGKETLVSFELKYLGTNSYPDFKKSDENKKWYAYLQEAHSRVARLNHLFDYLSNFSHQVTGKQITTIYQIERRKYYKLFNGFVKNNATSWASLVVTNTPYYFSNLKKEPVVRDFIRLNFFWEGIDTSNLKLINTPVYSEHIENYLNSVIKTSEKATITFKEYQLKKAIDVVIEQFSKSSVTRRYAVDCLTTYFNKLGGLNMSSALNHVVQIENLHK